MGEENKTRDVIDAVTGVATAIPIYDDLLQPAVKEIGRGLQTVAKTVHVALAPVSALVWGYDQVKDFVNNKVSERLKNVAPENIVTPKPNVAGPVLEALRYTGHEDSLSDMYANLLAASMDRKTASEAHPAFAEIIKQLTPDEAKIVGLFVYETPFPLLNVRANMSGEGESGGSDILTNFSTLGQETGCEHIDLVPTYIDNLCRLGLAEVPTFFKYTRPGVYDYLEASPIIKELVEQINGIEGRVASVERGGLRVTALGKQFARVCILRKN